MHKYDIPEVKTKYVISTGGKRWTRGLEKRKAW
jgi:hypothetical protein